MSRKINLMELFMAFKTSASAFTHKLIGFETMWRLLAFQDGASIQPVLTCFDRFHIRHNCLR